MSEKVPNLPNWDSTVETYLKAAELYGKDAFTTRKLAAAKLGTDVSAPAIDAEATSLYNLLRMAAMYGLVEWYGGEEFAVRVAPDAESDEWDDSFYARATLLRGIVEKLRAEQKKLKELSKRKIETLEEKNRTYLVAYVGLATDADGINGFVFNVWDPKKHAGVVLKARGHNIAVAKDIAAKLCRGGSETLSYKLATEDIRRGEQGLEADIFLEVAIGETGVQEP
jgi:hypothetical protein